MKGGGGESFKKGEEAKDVSGTITYPKGLPYTELLLVFQFLDAKDICRAACVAGKWHRYVNALFL